MFIWAAFTLGYLAGVFFTLTVFLKKDEREEDTLVNNQTPDNMQSKNSWQVFSQLTKPNYRRESPASSIVGLQASKVTESSTAI